MTWSLQQKAKYLLDEKMTSFLVVVATKMVVKKKEKGKVVWRSQKQVVTFFGRGRDQFGPKKLVVTFWSGATKLEHITKMGSSNVLTRQWTSPSG